MDWACWTAAVAMARGSWNWCVVGLDLRKADRILYFTYGLIALVLSGTFSGLYASSRRWNWSVDMSASRGSPQHAIAYDRVNVHFQYDLQGFGWPPIIKSEMSILEMPRLVGQMQCAIMIETPPRSEG